MAEIEVSTNVMEMEMSDAIYMPLPDGVICSIPSWIVFF